MRDGFSLFLRFLFIQQKTKSAKMSATPAPAPMPAWAATVSPLVFSESLVLAAASEVLELEAAVEVPDAVLLEELVAEVPDVAAATD